MAALWRRRERRVDVRSLCWFSYRCLVQYKLRFWTTLFRLPTIVSAVKSRLALEVLLVPRHCRSLERQALDPQHQELFHSFRWLAFSRAGFVVSVAVTSDWTLIESQFRNDCANARTPSSRIHARGYALHLACLSIASCMEPCYTDDFSRN